MAAVLARGYIQLYTGDGKGKTTAAIGAALRATQRGLRVAFIQFLKSGYDEETIKLIPGIMYRHFGLDFQGNGWCLKTEGKTESPRQVPQLVKDGWCLAKEFVNSGEYDLIILDELNVVLFFDLISLEDVLAVLRNKPLQTEIIITGRQAPEQLREMADLVTDMKEIKHWYTRGVKARVGIEY
ncbi:MAG: cob(I)yrinic acid a,c-diamide adenosyltransferase [Candidatus Babeliaceae bacterium]|nr:cob(I)yrinic acid a,c-diamide adenosyltransferase [Candidatus Babeliaceae bacterium]